MAEAEPPPVDPKPDQAKELEPLLSSTQAARYLSVSQSTIWRLVNDGLLKDVPTGSKHTKFRKADLDAYLEQRRAEIEATRQARRQKAQHKKQERDEG